MKEKERERKKREEREKREKKCYLHNMKEIN